MNIDAPENLTEDAGLCFIANSPNRTELDEINHLSIEASRHMGGVDSFIYYIEDHARHFDFELSARSRRLLRLIAAECQHPIDASCWLYQVACRESEGGGDD